MSPLWILLIGIVVVVAGVLALRMHAFLALIAGALVVALLTPGNSVYRSTLPGGTLTITGIDEGGRTVTVRTKARLAPGTPLVLLRPAQTSSGYQQVALLRATGEAVEGGTKAEVVWGQAALPNVAGDVLVDAATEAGARKALGQSLGERIAEGFGRTTLEIGILIAMAAIVGETLLASGAAERIVVFSRRVLGDDHAALAFLVSGYVLGIPVFFDTVFYLLIPLGKVMRARSGRDYTLYVLSIVAGATMTHSLVPPTPGPLFVAAELKVSMATMILGGMIVGAIAAGCGYVYALYANRRWDIPLRATAGLTQEDLEAVRPEETLPPLTMSLAPILLPVVLITAAALADVYRPAGGWTGATGTAVSVLKTLGEKNIALAISAVIGLLMLVAYRRHAPKGRTTAAAVGDALASAGVIILITSAGGAFGYVLRQTDIASVLKEMLPVTKLALLPLIFLVTAAIRTAQGSATVAMITAAGIVSPIAAAGELAFHPVYLALAIGCGSKPGMWMNDSGFWIIGKMAGFTEGETLRTASVMMTIMGVVGLAATILGAWLFPLT